MIDEVYESSTGIDTAIVSAVNCSFRSSESSGHGICGRTSFQNEVCGERLIWSTYIVASLTSCNYVGVDSAVDDDVRSQLDLEIMFLTVPEHYALVIRIRTGDVHRISNIPIIRTAVYLDEAALYLRVVTLHDGIQIRTHDQDMTVGQQCAVGAVSVGGRSLRIQDDLVDDHVAAEMTGFHTVIIEL